MNVQMYKSSRDNIVLAHLAIHRYGRVMHIIVAAVAESIVSYAFLLWTRFFFREKADPRKEQVVREDR